MEALVRYLLKSVFEEYLTGFDGEMDTTRSSVTLCDLSLRDQKLQELRKGSTSAVELQGCTIGSLTFKALEFGKVQVVANDVAFDFNFSPVSAGVKQYMASQDASAPGFVHRVQDLRSAGHWEALLGSGRAPQPIAPRYCGAHRRPERLRRGPIRMADCRLCKARMQTNYVACALCPSCSGSVQRCLVCGDPEVVGLTPEERERELADERVFRDCSPLSSPGASPQPSGRNIRNTHSAPLPRRNGMALPEKGVLPQTNDDDDDDGLAAFVDLLMTEEEAARAPSHPSRSRGATAMKKVPWSRGDDGPLNSPCGGLSSRSTTRLSSREAGSYDSFPSQQTLDPWAGPKQPSVHQAPQTPPWPETPRRASLRSLSLEDLGEESCISRPCTSRALSTGGVSREKPPSPDDSAAQRWETLSELGDVPTPPPDFSSPRRSWSGPVLPMTPERGPEATEGAFSPRAPAPEPPPPPAGAAGRKNPVAALYRAFSNGSFQSGRPVTRHRQ